MAKIQYTEKDFNEAARLKRESIFHVASGKLGIRGSFEEGAPEGALSIRGAYLNGFCENEPITYNERLHGFPEEKQQIVNLPDAQTIRLTAAGQLLTCFDGTDLIQTMDMEAGVYTRSFVVDTGSGRLAVRFSRLAPFPGEEVFSVECAVTSLGYEGELTAESCLNPDVRNFTDRHDPRVASGDGKMLQTLSSAFHGDVLSVICQTRNSRRMVCCASVHDLSGMIYAGPDENGLLTAAKTWHLSTGDTITFHKYTVYREIFCAEDENAVIAALKKTAENGFDALKASQRSFLDTFWRNARVTVEGNDELQAQLDFSLYGMLSSAGRDGTSNVAAKGLSGEGYEGHYFWDSEIYVFPFFLTAAPEVARSLLEYRYRHLDGARAHAAKLGHFSGALYPWRTITGSECSSHYPSGSAQYHINGDIAHAFISYWNATKDVSFLENTCEVLVETARLWMDTGHWLDGCFRIDCVTGPDEYTCLVNNNYYTNACASENLINACRLFKELESRGLADTLKAKLSVTDEELEAFRLAGEGMFFPHDEKLGIIAQDDSFLQKKQLDFSLIPKENYPLLMHYHPILINRYQVLKQADSVLANHIYREEDVLTMKRSYEYYEAVTTHDSSLSNCIYAIMAARLGDVAHANDYFFRCVGTDTSDQNGNTRDGLHIANMGGIYRVMTAGFGGLKIDEKGVSLFPLLPASVRSISFPFYYQGSRVLINAAGDACTLTLTEGESFEMTVYGQRVCPGRQAVSVKRRISGAVFDLDGVITDTAKFHYLAWQKLADELGIAFNEEMNESFKGVSRAQCLKMLLQWGNRKADDAEFASLLERKNNYYCALLDTLTPADILPGIKDALQMLRENGIPSALFSVSKNTDRILAQLDMTGAFDAVVTGNDIAHSKPHYEGYLKAAERLGVDVRLCVMIEDSCAGIEGAQKLSMKTLAIMKENTPCADLCIPDTTGVCNALRSMM